MATCAIAQGEIRYGLERLPLGKRRADLEAKAGIVLAALTIEPITHAAADIYGTIRRDLELQGRTIDDNDLWIAAAALSLGARLVSNDQGFLHVPGLVVEDWTQ
jgi:tRNA(fMet)-specific endonuclease VapC